MCGIKFLKVKNVQENSYGTCEFGKVFIMAIYIEDEPLSFVVAVGLKLYKN